jgi:hypothetical protein
LLTWTKPDATISYFPPDDVRLDSGSYFDSLGMGINEAEAPSSLAAPTQNNKQNTITKPAANTAKVADDKQNNTADDAMQTLVFTAYPNPAAHILHLSSNIAMQTVAVYDMVGRQCIAQQTNGATTATLDLQKLVNGIYIVRMYGTNGQTAVKQIQVVK